MGDTVQNDMEKLFLLEVLVDNLFIKVDSSSLNLNKDLASNMADTCVMFQFLHYPPLIVCESDFIGTAVSGKDTSHITFKSGKSCFFSLRSPKGPILPVPFEVKVSVIRKMKEGVLPDKLELGKTSIDMGENFTELLKQDTDENCDALPLSKVKKGTFDIKDETGRKVGNLTVFLRLSCFGKLIITQFSLNKEDEKTYLFKGTDLKQMCKEGLGKPQQPPTISADQGEDSAVRRQSLTAAPTRGYYPASEPPKPSTNPLSPWEQNQIETFDLPIGPPSPLTRGVYPASQPPKPPTKPLSPWEQNQIDTFDPRLGPPSPLTGGRYPASQPPKPPTKPLSPWEQNQIETFDPRLRPPPPTRGPPPTEFSSWKCTYPTEMLTPPKPSTKPLSPWEQNQIETFDPRLRPPPLPTRGPPPTEVSSWKGTYPLTPYPPIPNEAGPVSPSYGTGGGRLCDCSYPVPTSVMSKYTQRTERNMNLAPGEVGMHDDQVIFQLPLKKPGDPLTEKDQQIDSQVYYKLTSAEETRNGVQKNTVNIKSDDIPGMATKTVSPVSGLPVDDSHDVFLLKIGKKCEGDKKRNLELELRTPKMKEPKPPMSDKDTQYLESDFPKTSKRVSKDKEKGKGKGKGGKKGKK